MEANLIVAMARQHLGSRDDARKLLADCTRTLQVGGIEAFDGVAGLGELLSCSAARRARRSTTARPAPAGARPPSLRGPAPRPRPPRRSPKGDAAMWTLSARRRNAARRPQARRCVRPVLEGFEPRRLLLGATVATGLISGTVHHDWPTGNGTAAVEKQLDCVTVQLFEGGGASPIQTRRQRVDRRLRLQEPGAGDRFRPGGPAHHRLGPVRRHRGSDGPPDERREGHQGGFRQLRFHALRHRLHFPRTHSSRLPAIGFDTHPGFLSTGEVDQQSPNLSEQRSQVGLIHRERPLRAPAGMRRGRRTDTCRRSGPYARRGMTDRSPGQCSPSCTSTASSPRPSEFDNWARNHRGRFGASGNPHRRENRVR